MTRTQTIAAELCERLRTMARDPASATADALWDAVSAMNIIQMELAETQDARDAVPAPIWGGFVGRILGPVPVYAVGDA